MTNNLHRKLPCCKLPGERNSTDMFGHHPSPSIYPDHPGSREKGGASEDAATQTAPLANARRAELFDKFLEAGDHGLTADEAIDAVKGDPRAYQPRISELIRLRLLMKTPQRRPTARGSTATVIKVHPQAEGGRHE
ncbi:MAG: hypothetical protein Q8M24_18570 [Pseudolabrys sp.]|nr:hypothetical protein [Pseudolabrys sp.]MDP2297451.1 hypothetical protein [Pseudolabrys sp.]